MKNLSLLSKRTLVFVGLLCLAMIAMFVTPVAVAAATPIWTFKGVLLGGAAGKLGLLGTAAAVPTGTPTLTNKNRAATELRSQARALRDEIMDTSKPMTKEELEKRVADMNSLEARANVIAEFTPDAEIDRQGGDGGVVERIDGSESGTRSIRDNTPRNMKERIEDFSKRAQREFGDVRSFVATATGSPRGAIAPSNLTEGQRRILDEGKTLTRAIVGTTGDISGGEFLLPLTQVSSVFSLSNVQQGLLQRARAYNVPGRTLRIPYLIQDDTNANTTLNRPMAGQIANVSIVGEGSTKPARTPEFGQRLLTVFKYAAITQASDEMLADDFTGELPQEFINAVGQQALNAVNEDITISGTDATGATTPAGALLAGAAYNIAVTRTTAGTIKPTDLFDMYSKHTHGPNSVWLASRRTVQALYNMSLTSASLVTFLKDLNQLPQMMILGYPVILTDLLNTLGTAGDFALVNPDFYAFALRQALTVESSRDYAFTQDLTTYRFVVRAGGIPINTGKYAYKYAGSNGVDEHSPFVYLNT